MKEYEEYIKALVEGVTKIANAINKKNGYATTHKEANVAIILEAYWLLLGSNKWVTTRHTSKGV